ncbi:hypothetical protein OROMI_007950 [Orobanche minor]
MYGLFGPNDSFSAENELDVEDDVDFQSNPTHNQEDQDRQSSFHTPSNPIGNSGNTHDMPMERSIGTIFATFNSLSTAYQDYAKQVGFRVIIRTIKKVNDMDKYAQLLLDRSRKSSTHKISKKTGCPAKLNAIKKDDGSWYVSSVINEHNHILDPNFSILMPGHRKLTIHMKRQLEAKDIAGIRPCKNVHLLEVQSGGPMKLGCIPKDCRNYIEERRRLRLGDGDAEAIRKTFASMQLKDRNFYHLMDIDSEGRLRNILWIHPRMKIFTMS